MATSETNAIIYVRVTPADKRALIALADADFEGSMAAAVRTMIRLYAVGRVQKAKDLSAALPKIFRDGFLDED
jgi:hypothetical protein